MGGNNATFEITLGLTKQGCDQHDVVVQRVFEALRTFAAHPVPSYITEENDYLRLVRYKYQSRIDPFDLTVSEEEKKILSISALTFDIY